ncbi:uncharacterized protein PODANS_1_870 [Podospora anserina S mat+]|uniref:Podospora anserina S mat+ genomic DNA chromosome 1, supercontig 1 n=1 Tax=Podospora anserina (strain S / ATCC MYA-4624 / DSM 980 / FGSC 10383) TaxID=515849 RepID=B2A9B5_PODAN|nr:uncharacterized protein PODANS_1_870 [Podospora anserina S mat+]CAP59662.1 unnamed protein product [Podospora anserina S mat+]CDP22303.1 Putative protein of unknown function [Podospora anserina S mat+]
MLTGHESKDIFTMATHPASAPAAQIPTPPQQDDVPVGYQKPSKEEIEAFYISSRLSMPPMIRLPLATMLSFGTGFLVGAGHGSKIASLQFRAEHAHKLPSTATGWYLYHKSKNYIAARGGLREGLKMGTKIGVWTTAVFSIEHMFDEYRGTADLFNTVTSMVTCAGVFSLWNRYSLPLAARTTKTALVVGTLYGGIQDILAAKRGRRLQYVEYIKRKIRTLKQKA